MKLREYLEKVFITKAYEHRTWWFSVFGILENSNLTETLKIYFPYIVYKENNKYYAVNEEKDPVPLAFGNERLLEFSEKLTVDKTIYPGIDGKADTTIGNWLANLILIYSNFGTKLKFKLPPYSIRSIESEITEAMVEDDKAKPEDITVSEYLDFVDSTAFIRGMSTLLIQSSTEKTITPPPNIEAKRKELLKKYQGQLDDYKVIAEIENQLLEYDKEYLANDPTYGKFMSGKVSNIARKRMFLTFGAEQSATDPTKANYVESPLSDGWSTKPEDLTAMFNSFRSGAEQRAKHTEKGGVLFKMFARVMNSYMVELTDCNTKKGMFWTVSPKDKKVLIGRSYIKNGKVVLIDNNTFKDIIGKTVEIRSPLYCKLPKKKICSVCAGEKLSLKNEGVSLAAMEISEAVMTASMKAMHGKVLSTTELDIQELLT